MSTWAGAARAVRTIAPVLLGAIAIAAAAAGSALAMASHEGWPPTRHHVGHPHNESGTMRGLTGVHNMLLGGDGNDRIIAGDLGDVIWGDSHPGGQPESQHDYLHGGPGPDWLYASHGLNDIWTGAGNDHVALVYGHGTVHCDGPGVKTLIVRYLPQNRHFRLVGCRHTVLVRYRA
jgi:RTX calcium-binding nonapeptide repeat (4 copies)